MIPITNGNGFVYPKYDFSYQKNPQELLAKASDKEINGEIADAKLIYEYLKNNLETEKEAKTHLERISKVTD